MKNQVNTDKTILAIDSSTGLCSVSILKNNKIMAYIEELSFNLQSKRLIMMVEEVLSHSKIEYQDLSEIACTVGPGSFTGIRIGLASARGIAFAAKIPIYGYSSLAVMAYAMQKLQENKKVMPLLNAGKGEVIYQYFAENMKPDGEPILCNSHPMGGEISSPRADFLAELALSHPELAVPPLPFYVRPPDAKLPQKSCLA